MNSTVRRFRLFGIALILVIVAVTAIRQKDRLMKRFAPPAAAPTVAVSAVPAAPLPSRTFERLRAVHYFADTYPKQFWNSFEPADVARDFKQIKADGFNSIVLVVPWGEFQPSLEGGKHDERMFARLARIMDAASAQGLGVILRLSYFWTYRPDAERQAADRMHRLFYDEAVRAAWLDHLGEMYRRVGKHPAFRLAFLCWEDLYPMEIASPHTVLKDAGILGEYRKYLARTSRLDEVSALYGQSPPFAGWDSVPFPARKSPAYARVFDYWDDALVNRLFAPANQRFPNLSFEVRVDWDPLWDSEGKLTSKNHASTYTLPGTNTLTTYYATSWGMRNEGDLATAAETLKTFDWYLGHVKANGNTRHLFIDQFLFYYSLPDAHARNTQIIPAERDQFLAGVATRMREQDISYALWYYRDYVDSAIYNAHFSLGLDGWHASDGVKAVAVDGRNAVSLPAAGAISQHVPATLRTSWNVFTQPHDVCLTRAGSVKSDAAAEVASGAGQVRIEWPAGLRRVCGKLKVSGEFDFSIRAAGKPLVLDHAELFKMVEPSAVYAMDGKPGPQLDAIRRLNAMVAGPESHAK